MASTATRSTPYRLLVENGVAVVLRDWCLLAAGRVAANSSAKSRYHRSGQWVASSSILSLRNAVVVLAGMASLCQRDWHILAHGV